MTEYNIPLPRIYDGRTLQFQRTIEPINVSIDLNIIPLSTATITMAHGETLLPRSFVELFAGLGRVSPTSLGMFRARNPVASYQDGTTEVEVESAIVEIGDYLVKDKLEKMMTVPKALKKVFEGYEGTFWQLMDETLLEIVFANERKVAVNCDHVSVLDAIMSIMEQIPSYMVSANYAYTPWRLEFSKRGANQHGTAEGRLSRNVQSLSVSYDDSEMCNRVWYEWNEGWNRADNPNPAVMQAYGMIEKTMSVGGDWSEEQVLPAVYEYLAKHAQPTISVEITADDLSMVTGQPLDTFQIGKMFHMILPDYNLQLDYVIKQMSWDNVYGSPREITLTLEDEEEAKFEFLPVDDEDEEDPEE